MTMFQMTVEDILMSELLQFQAHNWHPVKQEKHLENAETHSATDESVGGKHNL